MSQSIDNFCDQLRIKLNDADKRLNDLKANAQKGTQTAKREAQAHLDWIENKVDEQQARIAASKAKIKAWAQDNKNITRAKIDEWKAQRQVKKLTDRADDAEAYASAAIDVALASLDRNQSNVEAIVARMDTGTAQPTPAAAAPERLNRPGRNVEPIPASQAEKYR